MEENARKKERRNVERRKAERRKAGNGSLFCESGHGLPIIVKKAT